MIIYTVLTRPAFAFTAAGDDVGYTYKRVGDHLEKTNTYSRSAKINSVPCPTVKDILRASARGDKSFLDVAPILGYEDVSGIGDYESVIDQGLAAKKIINQAAAVAAAAPAEPEKVEVSDNA